MFGILLFFVGGILLFAAINILLFSPSSKIANASVPPISSFAALLQMAMGVAACTLGIGSFKGRRWARAIILCVAWIALCAGIVAMPLFFTTVASVEDLLRQQGQTVPRAVLRITQTIMLGTSVAIYVIFPAVLIWFFRREDVRLTCNRLDPTERWTDLVPLPVLALVLLQGYTGLVTLSMFPQFGSAFPLLGTVVTGSVATTLWLTIAAFSMFAAWRCYSLDQHAWLAYLIGVVVLGSSTALTFTSIDPLEYYRIAGMEERQLALLAQSPLLRSGVAAWLPAIGSGLMVGYMFWVRRYFFGYRRTAK